MSTLRVNQVIFNDGNNAYYTQANTNNVSLYVNGTQMVSYLTNNTISIPNGVTLYVKGVDVGNGAASGANSLQNTTTTLAGSLTITGTANVQNSVYLATGATTANVGIGLSAPTARLHVRGSAVAEITTLTDAASIYPDMTSNTNFTVTLAGNRTMQNPNTMITGQSGVFYVQQDSTGSRTLSWGSYYRFSGNTAPTLSTSANSVDVVAYAIKNTTSIVCQTLLNVGG